MSENVQSENKGGQIAHLQEEVRELRALVESRTGPGEQPAEPAAPSRPVPSTPSSRLGGGVAAAGRAGARGRRAPSFLAPGYSATTVSGSLYDTILRSLAMLAKLALHEHLFDQFAKDPTREAAEKLLEQIGVYLPELEQVLFADLRFREHQERKTALLKNRAATGDLRAKAILEDPVISDGRGNWRGDLQEALAILYGGRHPGREPEPADPVRRGKNVRILRRAKLVFDRGHCGSNLVVYLYPRKYYRLFARARALAGR